MDAVKVLVNQSPVLAAETGVAGEGDGSGIGQIGSGNSTPGTALVTVSRDSIYNESDAYGETLEDFDNGFDLGVVKGVLGGICVDTHSVHCRLVTCIQGRGRILEKDD
jgi:hypothetical protein